MKRGNDSNGNDTRRAKRTKYSDEVIQAVKEIFAYDLRPGRGSSNSSAIICRRAYKSDLNALKLFTGSEAAFLANADPKFVHRVANARMEAVKRAKEAMECVELSEEELEAGTATYTNPDGSASAEFRLMFTSIGSGDCILIRTPQGQSLVIDCGQRSQPRHGQYVKEIQDLLKEFVGTERDPDTKAVRPAQLSYLIFTHPDKDHYCEAPRIVFNTVQGPRVLLYTLTQTSYGESVKGSTAARNHFKKAKVCGRLVINNTKVGVTTPGGKEITSKFTFDGERLKLIEEPDCEISLLSAEASPSQHESCPTNAASIVTFIKVYGRKILLTGDATLGTEAFLLRHHGELIRDLDLLQMEHHGSGTEHAGRTFVETTNPRIAVASSGPHQSDRNPRWSTIAAYMRVTDGLPSQEGNQTPAPTAHRLCKGVDTHLIRYGTETLWHSPTAKVNWWQVKPAYKKYGIYTTDSGMSHLQFFVTPERVLERRWTSNAGDHRMKVLENGVVDYTPPTGGSP
ncbi:ComEC/Rec2 family competence protein [Vitiosangium sp. GDMCC 1.1324]|uniref:ComEC/Rec2 family competence protein n=1 Tax=Vitiosangium sp. (strain GDMCC 1.1324) TaxID=2138576 RepID=UPI000D39556F|nr:hypothetical protein [Vitiosangium sp. GDMCC 1.1324]PTL80852.1 hypothetical protein DAT35_26315 [Vitiosangium sp. GDMCC 1.1324]